MIATPQRVVLRARRLMVVGLVVSVLGNRLIDGGFDALTAAGSIAVGVLVAIKSLDTVSVMAFPLYARFLKRVSPDSALITVDFVEAALSAAALLVVVALPQYAIHAIVAYVLIDIFLAPVSDIADEFYGAKLADYGEDQALAFNAALYSLLGLLGFVIASPAGALLSGLSLTILLAGNVVLSLGGAGFRIYARRKAPMPPLLDDADADEFSVTGAPLPLRQFLHDLLRSGPASPLLSLVLNVAAALTGELLMLWVAALAGFDAHVAMGIVIATFGVAATVGPLVGKRIRSRWETGPVLRVMALIAMVNVVVLLAQVIAGAATFVAGLVFVLVNIVLSRARIIILETHRQTFFKGGQFARVMSWSYSFGAVGTLAGLQLGYWLGLVTDPRLCLAIAAATWLVVSFVVRSTRGSSSPTAQ